jgi:hypothetical protein
LCAAHDVEARQNGRDCLCLNRARLGIALILNGTQ